ncbi:hypothetical protein BC628DRAFT_1339506 [Trametes gibbosa]|nr:hypothetical protein BC628DRAFT_1339506 [Trametes gibbosa]
MPRGCGSYARRELQLRAAFRQSVAKTLVDLTDDPDAFMRWTVRGYHRQIYTRYGLALVGWPDELPFADPSKPELTGLARISRLLACWQSGELKFVTVELDRAARAAKNPMDVAPSAKNGGIQPRLGRSDIKKRRARAAAAAARFPARYVRDGPKSARWVSAAAEARAEHGRGEDPDDPIEDFTDDETLAH